jgi:hypothetical protein
MEGKEVTVMFFLMDNPHLLDRLQRYDPEINSPVLSWVLTIDREIEDPLNRNECRNLGTERQSP